MNEVFSPENLFLFIIGFIWIIVASIQDLRKREVANWLNFSLIAIALAYRLFYSIFFQDYLFLVYGIMGFAVFFLLANLFYYGRVFAGGDAKLLMGVGAILPFYNSFFENLAFLAFFIFLLLLVGGIYGLIYSVGLLAGKRKKFIKEFKSQLIKRKMLLILSLVFSVVLLVMVLSVGEFFLLVIPVVSLIMPFMLAYAKSIEETCMIKEVRVNELGEGEWLCENLLVKGRKIKASWHGLSGEDLEFLRKNYKGKIKIKIGVPFVPSFLLAFIVLLWNPFGSFRQFFF